MYLFNGSKLDIDQSIQLNIETKRDLEKAQKLHELAEADMVKTIQKNVTYINLSYGLKKGKEWFYKIQNGEKIDRRRKYEEKEHFEFLIQNLKERVFGERDIEIVGFSQEGYTGYNNSIYVKYKDYKFELSIPDIQQLDVKHFHYMHEGNVGLYIETGSNRWDYIIFTYDENELKPAFENYLKEKEIE